jgi:hypothetical protein
LPAGKNNSSDYPHELADLSHLTISIKLVNRRAKHYSKSVTCGHHIRASVYMPMQGLGAGGITPDFKQKTKVILFLNLVFIYCVFFFILLWGF